ncbi:multicopper oxidase family protein [Cryptosporangium minutisporangium]|uniref:Multicopper oxidase family protein n=1 Tax=Cryptosporangium minutisporangium TaxID=113569 RepID=A0ABP6ST74_9ACTN
MTQTVSLEPEDEFDLHIGPIRKRIGGDEIPMLAYNGSVPGPTLRVRQGSEVTVHVTNDSDADTTVHWHGLRLENRFDGVPGQTQPPIPPGGTFAYRLRFGDPGLYWYHPHLREDYGQEMGLYAPIVVEPANAAYWPPVDRDLTITLDDVLLEDGQMVPFDRSGPNFAAMGRFGNVLLTNGETTFTARAAVGEVVRLYLVNTANTRIFRVALPGARMKLVGSDSGRYEQEAFVSSVLLAPSERAVVDVRFDSPGQVGLEHRTPERVYELGSFSVAGAAASFASFESLRTDPELTEIRRGLGPQLEREPDKTLTFVAEMPGMHHHHHHHDHDAGDGIEWEDTMPEMNRASDPSNTVWKLVDADTGAENHQIAWTFTAGDTVKIRLVNTRESDHPMHHPFHVHGAGRFLVLARDGVIEPNLAWKDTVLLRTGETVDILLHVTNPGRWMAHCHIAEHHESGMMFSFDVRGASFSEVPRPAR